MTRTLSFCLVFVFTSLFSATSFAINGSGLETGPAAPGRMANSLEAPFDGSYFIDMYDPVADECELTDAGVDVTVSYDLPGAPQVDLLQYVDGNFLGNYDLSFFFTDLMSTDKYLNLESDFPFSEPDLDFVYTWVMNVYQGGDLTDSFEVTRDCQADTASLRRLSGGHRAVPTLGLWAILLLVGLLGTSSWFVMRRRRS